MLYDPTKLDQMFMKGFLRGLGTTIYVYVQSFLRPRILTFLLSNTATEYKFATILLLSTVSVEAFFFVFDSKLGSLCM